jgi:uncharacterized protein YdhG (YjbR/CyaY superfamily)
MTHYAEAPMSPKMKKYESVEAYLADQPDDARAALEQLRKRIRVAAPRAEEGMTYGMPGFKLHGRPLVSYAAFSDHCSFFPMSPKVLEDLADEVKGLQTSKGTIQFRSEKPLPPALVKKIVKARIEEIEARRR